MYFGCAGGSCILLVSLAALFKVPISPVGVLSRNFQCDLPVLRLELKLLFLLVSVILADFKLVSYWVTSVIRVTPAPLQTKPTFSGPSLCQ